MKEKIKVLIAGIGGASLGTEILKSLLLAGRYVTFGCDISSLAFGHYLEGFNKTFVIDRENYMERILDICIGESISAVIPGGEEPLVLLNEARDRLAKHDIKFIGNSRRVIELLTDKESSMRYLSNLGFRVPESKLVKTPPDLEGAKLPCIIKPASDSGGSDFVFFAGNIDEAFLYAKHLWRNGKTALLQEYIPLEEGEFTVGVLSLESGEVLGSIALKRIFQNKLSVRWKGKTGLISSGYTQGLIDDFAEVRKASEEMARSLHSRGPLNIQGRVMNGVFMPFELNPRFSASTYLRAKAGLNEVDIFVRALKGAPFQMPSSLRYGYYLRSFSEVFVPKEFRVK